MKGYATRGNRNSGKAKRKAERIDEKRNARFASIEQEIIRCKQTIAALEDDPDGYCYFGDLRVRRDVAKRIYEEALIKLLKNEVKK